MYFSAISFVHCNFSLLMLLTAVHFHSCIIFHNVTMADFSLIQVYLDGFQVFSISTITAEIFLPRICVLEKIVQGDFWGRHAREGKCEATEGRA